MKNKKELNFNLKSNCSNKEEQINGNKNNTINEVMIKVKFRKLLMKCLSNRTILDNKQPINQKPSEF